MRVGPHALVRYHSVRMPDELEHTGTIHQYRLQVNDGCELTPGALRALAYTRVSIHDLAAIRLDGQIVALHSSPHFRQFERLGPSQSFDLGHRDLP